MNIAYSRSFTLRKSNDQSNIAYIQPKFYFSYERVMMNMFERTLIRIFINIIDELYCINRKSFIFRTKK